MLRISPVSRTLSRTLLILHYADGVYRPIGSGGVWARISGDWLNIERWPMWLDPCCLLHDALASRALVTACLDLRLSVVIPDSGRTRVNPCFFQIPHDMRSCGIWNKHIIFSPLFFRITITAYYRDHELDLYIGVFHVNPTFYATDFVAESEINKGRHRALHLRPRTDDQSWTAGRINKG